MGFSLDLALRKHGNVRICSLCPSWYFRSPWKSIQCYSQVTNSRSYRILALTMFVRTCGTFISDADVSVSEKFFLENKVDVVAATTLKVDHPVY